MMSQSVLVVSPRLRRWISWLDPVEAAKVPVMGVDDTDAVLAHQRRHVRVGDIVSSWSIAGGRPEDRPETVELAGRSNVGSVQERLDVPKRVRRGEGIGQDSGVGDDPQVAQEHRPEQVEDLGSGGNAAYERLGLLM